MGERGVSDQSCGRAGRCDMDRGCDDDDDDDDNDDKDEHRQRAKRPQTSKEGYLKYPHRIRAATTPEQCKRSGERTPTGAPNTPVREGSSQGPIVRRCGRALR